MSNCNTSQLEILSYILGSASCIVYCCFHMECYISNSKVSSKACCGKKIQYPEKVFYSGNHCSKILVFTNFKVKISSRNAESLEFPAVAICCTNPIPNSELYCANPGLATVDDQMPGNWTWLEWTQLEFGSANQYFSLSNVWCKVGKWLFCKTGRQGWIGFRELLNITQYYKARCWHSRK